MSGIIVKMGQCEMSDTHLIKLSISFDPLRKQSL
jgi:hypothetical protein